MITVSNLELRAGARLLMDDVDFRVQKGDKVGLVGRNGAGKTTMTRVLAGALDLAASLKDDYVATEHLLLAGGSIRAAPSAAR